MPFELPPITPDPVIDAYKPGIDMTLIRENLKLTPAERLEKLQRAVRAAEELSRIGRESGLGKADSTVRGPEDD